MSYDPNQAYSAANPGPDPVPLEPEQLGATGHEPGNPTPGCPACEAERSIVEIVTEHVQLSGSQVVMLAAIAALTLALFISGFFYMVIEVQRASVCPTEEVGR